MIKKIKLSLLIALFSLVGVGLASASDLTYSSDTTVDLSSPDINLTILSGSGATSVVVGTGTVVVTVPVSTTFTISSADRELSFTGQSQFGVISANCSSAQLHTLTITAPSDAAQTITLTPLSYACFPSGGGGGGGGGGSTYVPPVTPATPATPATPGTEIPGCGNRTTGFSTSTGVSCVGNTSTTPATPATPASPSSASEHRNSFNFGTKTLKNGSRGEAVMELQRFLNQVLNLGLVVDGKLGPKTIKVIKQWQKDNGLVADGLVGPKTKAMMNASVQ